MQDVTLDLEFEGGEIRQTHVAHWVTAGLPRQVITRMVARRGLAMWTINAAAEYAVWDPPPHGPLMIFAVERRGEQVAGVVWEFRGDEPTVRPIDETIGSMRLPPASAFLPGTSFREEPRTWLQRLRARSERPEDAVLSHRSSSSMLRSRR